MFTETKCTDALMLLVKVMLSSKFHSQIFLSIPTLLARPVGLVAGGCVLEAVPERLDLRRGFKLSWVVRDIIQCLSCSEKHYTIG